MNLTFLNRKEVCEKLRISIDTFEAWVRAGLPEYRIGRIIMVKQQELDGFIEAHGTAAQNELVSSLVADVLAKPKRQRKGRAGKTQTGASAAATHISRRPL